MGTVHLLEVLHALLQYSQSFTSSLAPSTTNESIDDHLPFPHFQQRVQQSLRGVLLVTVTSTLIPFVLVSLLPIGSTFDYGGLWVVGFLVFLSLVQLVLRNVMFPYPRRVFLSDQSTTVYGWTQTIACTLVECSARLYQDPQLLVLIPLSVLLSWMWKSVAYGLVSDAAANDVNDHFTLFTVVHSLVSLISFLLLEKRWSEDPFVLDPRSVLTRAMQNDLIRALRRSVLSWFLARILLMTMALVEGNNTIVFSFFPRFHRTIFHLMTNTIENFVLLSVATVFRILLFRAKCSTESLDAVQKSKGSSTGGWYGLKAFSVSSQSMTPLVDQYIVAQQTRIEHAQKSIASRKVQAIAPSVEHMQSLEDGFQLTNVALKTRYDASSRVELFSSEAHWVAFVSKTTSVVDEFTLSLQLLQTLTSQSPMIRSTPDTEREMVALERSWVGLIRVLLRNAHQHPLMILNAYPFLATLRISSRAVPSKIKYFVAAPIQFAIRRLLVEEARRRVFVHAKVVYKSQQVLTHLVCASRKEDLQGNVQHAVPVILSSMVECRQALESYTDTAAKMGNMNDIYAVEANALATALDKSIYHITETFEKELRSLALNSSVRVSLEEYTSYRR